MELNNGREEEPAQSAYLNKTLQPTRGTSGFLKVLGVRKNLAFTTCSAVSPGQQRDSSKTSP